MAGYRRARHCSFLCRWPPLTSPPTHPLPLLPAAYRPPPPPVLPPWPPRVARRCAPRSTSPRWVRLRPLHRCRPLLPAWLPAGLPLPDAPLPPLCTCPPPLSLITTLLCCPRCSALPACLQTEDRPIVKERVEYIQEHRPVEKEFVVGGCPPPPCSLLPAVNTCCLCRTGCTSQLSPCLAVAPAG